MNDPRHYRAEERLRDGEVIRVRAIRPADKQRLQKHAEGLSAIIGVGRYAVLPGDGKSPRAAELAFSVVDAYQHHGIGTLLFEHLLCVARDQGIDRLEAEVGSDNRAMMGLFDHSGLVAKKSVRSGVVHVVFSTDSRQWCNK